MRSKTNLRTRPGNQLQQNQAKQTIFTPNHSKNQQAINTFVEGEIIQKKVPDYKGTNFTNAAKHGRATSTGVTNPNLKLFMSPGPSHKRDGLQDTPDNYAAVSPSNHQNKGISEAMKEKIMLSNKNFDFKKLSKSIVVYHQMKSHLT